MAIAGGRWRNVAERHEAAVAAVRAWRDEERRAAFALIPGLAECWRDLESGREAKAA